jgi:hypothetical protein
LLNRAARFFPILRELRAKLPPGGTLLEVGSGAAGLGEFWTGSFVGCDIAFGGRPVENMQAVRCSGHQLPFANDGFDAVVLSDVMEHVPPEYRAQVVYEALRVARRIVIFGYPCGPKAFELDKKLHGDYLLRKISPPVWLEEHMLHGFPDVDLLDTLPTGWKKKRTIPNENLGFHYWMMRTEMIRLWDYALRAMLRAMPRLVEFCLRQVDREPSYRKIFVLTYEPEASHG